MSFPALDLAAFQHLSTLPAEYVQHVEDKDPEFVAGQIARVTSWVYARLRKLYGKNAQRSGIPFGQAPAPLTAAGTSPPAITLSGVPTLGSYVFVVQITTPGPLGTAIAQWSSNGGKTWTAGALSAASVVLGATGVTASFGAGTYSADNVYRAKTPVPEIVLGWIVDIVNVRVVRKHKTAYMNEKSVKDLEDEATRAVAEITEAANGQTGLFDIPINEDSNSARTTGGMLSYSESSPFVSADRQEFAGLLEDERGFGSFGP